MMIKVMRMMKMVDLINFGYRLYVAILDFTWISIRKFPWIFFRKFPWISFQKFPWISFRKFPWISFLRFSWISFRKFPWISFCKFSWISLQLKDYMLNCISSFVPDNICNSWGISCRRLLLCRPNEHGRLVGSFSNNSNVASLFWILFRFIQP